MCKDKLGLESLSLISRQNKIGGLAGTYLNYLGNLPSSCIAKSTLGSKNECGCLVSILVFLHFLSEKAGTRLAGVLIYYQGDIVVKDVGVVFDAS